MGIWYDLFHRGLIKRYDHIASLGYNCEIAYQLFKHNRFLESNLFAWSYIPSLDRLIEVLGDVSMIGRDGYAVTGHALYNDKTTGIGFHGRAKPSEVADNPAAVAEDVRELTGRVAFLKDKFVKTARDEGRKLYAIKIKSGEPDVFAKLERLRGRLTALTGGGYDLLVVMEAEFAGALRPTDGEGVYCRAVPFCSPDSAVTGRHKNFKAWQRIFDEFRPRHKMKQTKHYKFEDLS